MKLTPIVNGFWAEVESPAGRVVATIFRPEPPGRPDWRICFAACTGDHQLLTGKVIDSASLQSCKDLLSLYIKKAAA